MPAHGSNKLQVELTALLPNLRAFALSLARNPDVADDLVQEAIIKAWQHSDQFAPGSNLKAWVFTILRNVYLSQLRRRKFEVEDVDGIHAEAVAVRPNQTGHVDLVDFERALAQLPREQREALILIGAEGFSYEDAALMCGCAVGTMKSRVNRARQKLAELMGLADAQEAVSYSAAAM